MEKQNNMELLSALTGGQDALQMLRRMERLKRLMGTTQPSAKPVPEKTEVQQGVFRDRKENMISAAIPFLDREYQKELYVIVRLMEMRRVLGGGLLEAREKEEQPAIRRRKLLGAIQPYLQPEEKNQLETIVKIMDMKAIMEREDEK